MKRRLCAFGIIILCLAAAAADSPVPVRAPVWVYLEPVPGEFAESSQPKKEPPIQELNELARFVMEGMVYGWNFSYSPSDAARKVSEEFTLEPIDTIGRDDPRFTVTDLVPDYPRLYCWAEFQPDEATVRRQKYWASVLFKSGKGLGKGERAADIGGIKKAYSEALKRAVREYARKIEKNKPKEIRGELMLHDTPRLYPDEGWFVAEVKVIINVREIIPYSTF